MEFIIALLLWALAPTVALALLSYFLQVMFSKCLRLKRQRFLPLWYSLKILYGEKISHLQIHRKIGWSWSAKPWTNFEEKSPSLRVGLIGVIFLGRFILPLVYAGMMAVSLLPAMIWLCLTKETEDEERQRNGRPVPERKPVA